MYWTLHNENVLELWGIREEGVEFHQVMQITFWGVRGSYPVPGAATVRYGGQTSCVEARSTSGETADRRRRHRHARSSATSCCARRRARRATTTCCSRTCTGTTSRACRSSRRRTSRARRSRSTRCSPPPTSCNQVIGGITRHEFFPMPLEAVPASFDFHQVEPGVDFDDRSAFTSSPIALNHPFGSVGYRIDGDGSSVGVRRRHRAVRPGAPQAALPRRPRAALVRRRHGARRDARGAGRDARGRRHRRLRHALPARGVRAVPALRPLDARPSARDLREAGVRRLVLYHHAPSHSDEQMDKIAADYLARARRAASRC